MNNIQIIIKFELDQYVNIIKIYNKLIYIQRTGCTIKLLQIKYNLFYYYLKNQFKKF